MSDEGRGRLDNAIDRAVRGMMQVDPAPGLRHRVAGRIEAPARRSWALSGLAAAAALVVVIAALALFRPPGTAPNPEPRVATAPPAAPATPPAAQTTRQSSQPQDEAARKAAEPVPPRTAESIFGKPTGRVSAANLAAPTPDAELEESSAPPPAVIAPLAPITIEPITISPIQIRPVTVPPIRDPR